MFSLPSSRGSDHSLDDLLISFGSIWKKANDIKANGSLAPDQACTLKQEALRLDRKFAGWEDAQLDSFKRTAVGHISETETGVSPTVGYWPGSVDTYFDLYTATVWNTYRTVRCVLVSLVLTLSSVSGDGADCGSKYRAGMHMVEDIIASIPYHLTEDLHAFLRDVESRKEIAAAGRCAGGLLVMQSLYVLSRLGFVSPRMGTYFKDCLTWIGKNMGIGQATLYAKVNHETIKIMCARCTDLHNYRIRAPASKYSLMHPQFSWSACSSSSPRVRSTNSSHPCRSCRW